MPKVQSGRPNTSLHAVSTVLFGKSRLIAVSVQNTVVIYQDVFQFIQTLACSDIVIAVKIDSCTGKIAAATKSQISIFNVVQRGNQLRWVKQNDFCPEILICSMAWGQDQYLLAGGDEVRLYRPHTDGAELLWLTTVPSHTRDLSFSPDGSLFATVGQYERVIKVWHRIPTPSTPDFSFVYLSHGSAVVHMQWKQPQDTTNVLFSIDAENTFNVWAPLNSWEPHILYQRASVNMNAYGIASRQSDLLLSPSIGIILNSGDITVSLETFFNQYDHRISPKQGDEIIITMAQRAPTLMLSLNLHDGKIIVWDIDVDCNQGKPLVVSKVLERKLFPRSVSNSALHSFFWAFSAGPHGSADLLLLEHTMEGRIRVSRLDLASLCLDEDSNAFHHLMTLLGHTGPHVKLTRTVDGRGLLSTRPEEEAIAWMLTDDKTIRLRAVLAFKQPSLSLTLLAGQYCLVLYATELELWCSNTNPPKRIHRIPLDVHGTFASFFQMPRAVGDGEVRRFVAITTSNGSCAWRIDFSAAHGADASRESALRIELDREGHFPAANELHLVSAVDPMGWKATFASDSLDIYTREVLVTISKHGVLQTWTTNLTRPTSSLEWLNLSSVETNVSDASLIHGTSERKVAVVSKNGNQLTIWDTRVSRFSVHEEYRKTFPAEDVIRDLDWTSTPDDQSILAVGFPRRVVLFCQQRSDYLSGGSTWVSYLSFDMHNLTPLPISDSIWLDQGSLVVASGAQLHVFDNTLAELDIKEEFHLNSHRYPVYTVFDVCRRLNGPLPVYHPQFLQQAILAGVISFEWRLICAGKIPLVNLLLKKLESVLNSEAQPATETENPEIDTFLETPIEAFLEESMVKPLGSPLMKTTELFPGLDAHSFMVPNSDGPTSTAISTGSKSLEALLERTSLPYLTSNEQFRLALIVDCMMEFERHQRSLDLNGSRYFLFFRQQVLSRLSKKSLGSQMSMRDILWAFHSHSQEILFDLISRTYTKPMKWENARESGIFLWMRHAEALRSAMEMIARNHYAQTEERNPVDCSLFYLALRKKTVLAGLWRSAGWHKEQPAMLRFLSNDFGDIRWRTAASKNAYALLAKQRYEYAAAFFLLADSLKDAVNVCIRNLHDYQLAVAIARVYEGDHGPVLGQIIDERVLPQAAESEDRWLASWGYWMRGDRGKAVQALILPLDHLIQPSTSSNTIIPIDDPALIVLYRHLKDKTLQTMQGAAEISPKLEFDYILRIASLYDRLGCDLLALDLIKNWQFSRETLTSTPKLLTRRRSTINDLKISEFRDNMGLRRKAEIPATVKEEASLLESFEFGF